MQKGEIGLEELRDAVSSAQREAPDVSGWSVGRHIHHCGLAMIEICRALADSTPPPPPYRPFRLAALVFRTGRIPRGHGQAPDITVPETDISTDDLASILDQAELLVAEAGTLDPKSWFKHFAFGILKRDRAFRLFRIHNRHHLRIIRDIRAA